MRQIGKVLLSTAASGATALVCNYKLASLVSGEVAGSIELVWLNVLRQNPTGNILS
tara:strand:- start:610 stop:777 length:168 start_codon:yes stop_codon:yes gene_type:complete